MTSGGVMNGGGGVMTSQIPFLDLAPMTREVRDDVDRGWARVLATMKQGPDLDIEYVGRQSLALDLWILARTIPVVLSTRGAL
jgi:hypothetical protein